MIILALALAAQPVVIDGSPTIPSDEIYTFDGDPYRFVGVGDSDFYPGARALKLWGGEGGLDVPYVDVYGHLMLHSELRATDTVFIYGKNGHAFQVFRTWEDAPLNGRVAGIDQEGRATLAAGAVTNLKLGLTWEQDDDGSPTGWSHSNERDVWDFYHMSTKVWRLTVHWMPQVDGISKIGDATHRLAALNTKTLTTEGLTVVGPDGVTVVGGLDAAGRFTVPGAGTPSAPAFAFASQRDATPSGISPSGTEDWCFTRGGVDMWCTDAAGLSPKTNLYPFNGNRTKAWAQVATRDLELIPQTSLGGCDASVPARVRAYTKGSTTSACVCVRESGAWVWRSMTPAGDCT